MNDMLNEKLSGKSNHALIEFNKKIVDLYEINKKEIISLLDNYDIFLSDNDFVNKSQHEINLFLQNYDLKLVESLKIRDRLTEKHIEFLNILNQKIK